MKNKLNRKISVLFQMDKLDGLNHSTDSTLAIIREGMKLKFEIWLGSPNDISLKGTQVTIKAHKLLDTNFKLGELKRKTLNKYDYFFIRQDPPFDLRYLTNCYILEIHKNFNKKPFFINDPSGIKNFTEKIFPLYFSDLMPQTYLTENEEFFLNILKKHQVLILKTLYNKGGEGIKKVSFSNKKKASSTFRNLIKTYSVPVVMQEFLKKVKNGDKRIILIDGTPVGFINRIPKEGNFKANLHLGGRAEVTTLTKDEERICMKIKKVLYSQGLFLVGIDLIDGKLTEINVTSPTGIVQIQDLTGINIAQKLWEKLLRKSSQITI